MGYFVWKKVNLASVALKKPILRPLLLGMKVRLRHGEENVTKTSFSFIQSRGHTVKRVQVTFLEEFKYPFRINQPESGAFLCCTLLTRNTQQKQKTHGL